METTIKTGDKIRIKDNLLDELVRCGFGEKESESFVKHFKGTTQVALDVYQGEDFEGNPEMFATVELCCEILLTACELIESK